MVAKPWFQRTILQEGLWNLSFFVDKDSILIKVEIFKNYMDREMINPWTQVKSYHGHFEISQTISYNEKSHYMICLYIVRYHNNDFLFCVNAYFV